MKNLISILPIYYKLKNITYCRMNNLFKLDYLFEPTKTDPRVKVAIQSLGTQNGKEAPEVLTLETFLHLYEPILSIENQILPGELTHVQTAADLIKEVKAERLTVKQKKDKIQDIDFALKIFWGRIVGRLEEKHHNEK